MERKNIIRGFRKLRVWQDAVELYVLACKILSNFPYEKKWMKMIGKIVFDFPLFQCSIYPIILFLIKKHVLSRKA